MIAKGSRKRAAPGASPAPALGDSSNFVAQSSQPMTDQYLRWDKGMDSTGYGDGANAFASNVYANVANQGISQEPSNQLTRRPMNTMMSANSYASGGNDSWPDVVDGLAQQTSNFNWVQTTDEEKLDGEALGAMEAAKKSRKQIPPFVQKLRSFLDESRNTELIRWSQNGDSFIVLDEEEFARTLIPELFKHANYASFVRQLNMYGFHKQVGLSDNSMRASERKNKSPSEYKNPYFRRGKPTWMWLIQKPKSTQSKGKGGRGKQEEGNDEEENYDVENPGVSNISSEDKGTTLRSSKPPLMIGQGENSLAQEELAALHQELRTIRQQHQAIAGVIQKIRRDHDQIFQQAQAFQDLHSRHENSINAILTFLATVYNRSLEGHGGTQNIGNMFAGSIPHDMPQQGSVVDVGELSDQTLGPSGSLNRRPVRRQPLLLQAPPNSSRSGGGRVIGTPSTPQTVDTPPNQDQYSYPHDQSPAPSHPVVEELPDQEYNHVPRGTPQQATGNNNSSTNLGLPERDIMSFINSANANEHNASATSQMDFGEALSHLQNRDGKGPLSPSERNGMLQMIANGSNQGPSSGSNDNALTSPNPPTAPVPNFDNWQASNDDIALLQKSMQETDSKLTNISNRLSPISPNGSIPGFEQGGYLPPPNDPLDFDQIFNSGDYFNDASNGNLDFGDESAFDGNSNFNFDDPTGTNSTNGYGANVDEEQGGRVLETVNSSEATSPANTVEDEVVAPPPPKRQRG